MMNIRTLILIALLVVAVPSSYAQTEFTYRTVHSYLEIPWEIEFGSDGTLWTSERIGLLSRIDLETGSKKVILDMRDELYHTMETGMLGFTWHPDFPDSAFVYVSTVGGTSRESSFRLVQRFTYSNDTLTDPVEIFRLEPADSTHQGCRLKIGQDRKLYVTMGDSPGEEGADKDQTLVGKVLRMNLDGSVPDDNPIPGELMFTKGHRNVQGFVQLPNGDIFVSEHGNVIEDEVNRLVAGRNYGWPIVEGVCDDPWELDYCDSAEVVEPAWSSGLSETIAPCGMEYYDHDLYPQLKNSLLLTALKNSAIYQLHLNEDGSIQPEPTVHIQRSIGRIRDVAIHPDGRIFLCTSNREPNRYFPFPLEEDDSIVELIPLPENAAPVLDAPDTVYVKALPGDEFQFPITIENRGTGNLRIDGLWTMIDTVPVRGDQWRTPVIIAPQTAYDLAAVFMPTEYGEWVGQLRVVTATQGTHDVFVVASTNVGLLAPVTDTVSVFSPVGLGKTFSIEFVNRGKTTIEIGEATVHGVNADLFTVVSVSKTELNPQEMMSVRVRYSPTESGKHEAILDIASDSYRLLETHLIGSTGISSVLEDGSSGRLLVYPNPTSSSVTIILPDNIHSGQLYVTDLLGTRVYESSFTGGESIVWNGVSSDGFSVGSGTFVVSVVSATGAYHSPLQILE